MTRRTLQVAGRISAALGAVLIVVAGTLAFAVNNAAAAALGTVTLSHQSGSVTDTPMFTGATTSAPCPATYGEEAALRVGPAETGPFANLTPSLGGGGYDTAPVTAAPNRSLAQALGAPPADGVYWVVVECFSLTAGKHPDRFVTPVTVTGSTWSTGIESAPTTLALTAAPQGTQAAGQNVTLTATVTPATAVGTVQFRNNGEPVGDPVPVVSGTATRTANDLRVGGKSFTASYTPAGPYDPAESGSVPYEITGTSPGPVETAIHVAATPRSPQVPGTEVTLTATVIPANAVGKVAFFDGTAQITSPVDVVSGTAAIKVTWNQANNRSVTAAFVPTDDDAYEASTSPVLVYVVEGTNPTPSSSTSTTPTASRSTSTTPTTTATATPSGTDDPTVDPTESTGPLPTTGMNIPLISTAGLALIGAGIVAILGARVGSRRAGRQAKANRDGTDT
ncbi:Ig-like domain-containing protein [Virgisporangium aurantiacum]|uniref:Bacterial Ig-like domain-containing protein n=1 Tax=Virgisporangium aurantiacum TaxID=175570 RepID=A0A8J3Z0I3_9ACTN|nr:Ig-like domain-containing protein [Virgisporangium aurantiacum]GIJ54212.1 hypothetical protein Vau01_017280 [Virgisporangium aurantiacum]